MRKSGHPEQDFQIALVRDLDRILDPAVLLFAVPNGGWRTRAEAGIFRAMGQRAGMPDLMLLCAGRAFGLELKTAKGTLSPAQQDMHARLTELGIPVAVVRTLDEALFVLEGWNIPTRLAA